MATPDLRGALEWAEGKGKFEEFQEAAKAQLAARGEPIHSADVPAAAKPAPKSNGAGPGLEPGPDPEDEP
jgi:hypothetical protein